MDEQQRKERALSKLQTRPLKLHLGCGQKVIEGFTNVDLLPLDHIDFIESVDNLKSIDNDCADLVYACHDVLEQFGRHTYKGALKEWFRVLKPGGVLRIAVPNLDSAVEHNVSTDLIVGGQKDKQDDVHNVIFELLMKDLIEIGFESSSIRKYDWRETDHSHIEDLPHMDKENGKSLIMEATKKGNEDEIQITKLGDDNGGGGSGSGPKPIQELGHSGIDEDLDIKRHIATWNDAINASHEMIQINTARAEELKSQQGNSSKIDELLDVYDKNNALLNGMIKLADEIIQRETATDEKLRSQTEMMDQMEKERDRKCLIM